MISSDWNQLQISKAELEEVFEPSIIDEWAIAFASALYFKQNQASKTLLSMIGSFFFISLLLLFPVNLIVLRQLELADNSSIGLTLILLISIFVSMLLLIISSFHLYKKAKKLKPLITLLEKVKQYNQLINSFSLLADINSIAKSKNAHLENTIKLKSIFNLTKNTLIESIKLENFIYRHQNRSIPGNYNYNPLQLLADFEESLASLPIEATERNTEYRQLFEDAVNLSLSVQQEMRQIWHLRQID